MRLTWGQLKERIDNKLKEAGKDDTIEIDYMDFNGSDEYVKQSTGGVTVYVGEELTVN